MSKYRTKHYPANALIHYATTNMLIVKSFRIDAGAQVQGTATTRLFNKGDIIYAFRVEVTEDVEGTSSTVQFGFTGNRMITAAVAEATLVPNYVFGNQQTAGSEACPYLLTADDTFDCIVATGDLTAGKFDVDVVYAPAQNGALGSEFKEFVTVSA